MATFMEIIGVIFGHEALRNGLEKIGTIVSKRVETLVTDDPRREVAEVLRQLEQSRWPADGTRAERLRGRLDTARARGDENLTVVALGHVLPRVDAKVDEPKARDVFRWLADMDEPTFWQTVELMKHTPIVEFLRNWIERRGLAAIEEALGMAYEFLNVGAKALDVKLQPALKRVRARAAKKGFWAWLD